MLAPSESNAREALRTAGLRCTAQRERIYEALRSTTAHPTAEELFAMVRGTDAAVSLATVYNTLDALTSAGLARRLRARTAAGACAWRFDADVRSHAHLVRRDGRIVDLPERIAEQIVDAIPPELVSMVEQELDVRVGRVSIEIHER